MCQMRQNFVAQFVQLLRHWLCNMQSGVVLEENWPLAIDQCWLKALQLSVHLIDLLSIHLRCNGFAGIQKAIVDQTGSRPPNSDHDLFFFFFDESLALGSVLELFLSSTTEVDTAGCHIKSTFHHMSQFNQEMVHC